MKLSSRKHFEQQLDYSDIESLNILPGSYFEFEDTCRELQSCLSISRFMTRLQSRGEMHSHNLMLAAQCIHLGYPPRVIYVVYQDVNAYLRAHSQEVFTLPVALQMTSFIFSRYATVMQEATPAAPAYSDLIRRVLFLIDKAFAEESISPDLSVQTLAHQLNISPNYLSSRFRREMGLTLTSHINHLRLRRGSTMLLNTSLSISEISERIGFADPAYYCMVSRRVTGMTPTQYRVKQTQLRAQLLKESEERFPAI